MVKIIDKSALKDARAPKLTKMMKALAKSKFGTAWGVFRDPATAKYLLCRRASGTNNAGQWGFPGGGVDEGESHKVAVKRETKEEILVDVPLSKFHPVMSQDKTNSVWFEIFLKITGKKTEEVDAFVWVFPYEMDEYDLHKSVRHYFKMLRGQTKNDDSGDLEE